jgi:hypothetical protein
MALRWSTSLDDTYAVNTVLCHRQQIKKLAAHKVQYAFILQLELVVWIGFSPRLTLLVETVSREKT